MHRAYRNVLKELNSVKPVKKPIGNQVRTFDNRSACAGFLIHSIVAMTVPAIDPQRIGRFTGPR